MRKLRSVVALSSVVAVMACQTAVASSSVTRGLEVVPASAPPASTASQSAQSQSASQSTSAVTTSAAAASGSKKTWIIAGVIAAVALVVLVVALTFGGTHSAY